jgi:peptide chain release factor subunit 1
MLTVKDLESLARFAGPSGHHVLSVYLDVNQSRESNLNRGYVLALREMLRSIEARIKGSQERQNFLQQAEVIQTFISNFQPKARSLACFSTGIDKPLEHWNLHIPLHNKAHWGEETYVRPLLEALGEAQPYLVVLADRHQGRILRINQSEIELHYNTVSEAQVKHSKKSGSDHIRSQMNFQRKAELHAHWHFKEIVELADRMFDSHPYHYLILSASSEVAGYLQRMLPKRLARVLLAPVTLPVQADPDLLQGATARVVEEAERSEEAILVEKLKVAASKQSGAVAGLTEILRALDQDMIWNLVYSESTSLSGKLCPTCKRLFRERQTSCNACHQSLEPVDDLIESLIHRVMRNSGKVKCVRGAAAAQLNELEGIGALLRLSARKSSPDKALVGSA